MNHDHSIGIFQKIRIDNRSASIPICTILSKCRHEICKSVVKSNHARILATELGQTAA